MGRIIKYVLLCLVVGVILSWLGATPSTLAVWLADLAEGSWGKAQDFIAWGGGYILMGAMIIVPVAALRWLMKRRDRG